MSNPQSNTPYLDMLGFTELIAPNLYDPVKLGQIDKTLKEADGLIDELSVIDGQDSWGVALDEWTTEGAGAGGIEDYPTFYESQSDLKKYLAVASKTGTTNKKRQALGMRLLELATQLVQLLPVPSFKEFSNRSNPVEIGADIDDADSRRVNLDKLTLMVHSVLRHFKVPARVTGASAVRTPDGRNQYNFSVTPRLGDGIIDAIEHAVLTNCGKLSKVDQTNQHGLSIVRIKLLK